MVKAHFMIVFRFFNVLFSTSSIHFSPLNMCFSATINLILDLITLGLTVVMSSPLSNTQHFIHVSGCFHPWVNFSRWIQCCYSYSCGVVGSHVINVISRFADPLKILFKWNTAAIEYLFRKSAKAHSCDVEKHIPLAQCAFEHSQCT